MIEVKRQNRERREMYADERHAMQKSLRKDRRFQIEQKEIVEGGSRKYNRSVSGGLLRSAGPSCYQLSPPSPP